MAKKGPRSGMYVTYGDVMINPNRFNSKVEHDAKTGCDLWTGPKLRQGYGVIGGYRVPGDQRIMMTVHRLAMKMHLGRDLADDEYVIHRCHNQNCVNTAHLVIGSLSTRAEMMHAKGNAPTRNGPKKRDVKKQKRSYKYTDEELIFLRTKTSSEIAARFNVTKTKACRMSYQFRLGYRWLDEKETK